MGLDHADPVQIPNDPAGGACPMDDHAAVEDHGSIAPTTRTSTTFEGGIAYEST
jgi:hypothetical protein